MLYPGTQFELTTNTPSIAIGDGGTDALHLSQLRTGLTYSGSTLNAELCI